MRSDRARSTRLTAVLGPTNTGKTHFAIERMLAHRSGMIGLPLRLLAREVYDRIVRLKGPADVALITGEERIVPKHPRFYICTVEAMPLDIRVAFLAIDEIQLSADAERGHIFTDRLLHARGEEETMFLGAATMRAAIQRFVPEVHFISRPRFSDLTYSGARKLTRLPRRSAVVAFSAEDVYGLADTVRSQRGGAAVVMGALSPRTRNAQVALYQSGEVDYLVATDAIGMGINIDVDHVAFAETEKFDGAVTRPLRPEEMGQIAGRAGRYMNDGTFGTTGDGEALNQDIVNQIENHRYDPVRVLQWRNGDLDFSSLDALIASLEAPPPMRGLARTRIATDHWTLRALGGDETIRIGLSSRADMRLLWDACQLPDFRKITADEHAKLVAHIYGYLRSEPGTIPRDWLARQVARLDIVEGDVATLAGRLAQIRTFTYAAYRPGWTDDPMHWQGETRAVEDRLSDALHERLTQRFIDRRTSVLMRQLREDDVPPLALDESGAVALGAEHVGKLEGFRFQPDPRAEGVHGRTLRAAATKALETEIAARARALQAAGDDEFVLSEHGQIWWPKSDTKVSGAAAVARLTRGSHTLFPTLTVLADETLRAPLRDEVKARLERWLRDHFTRVLGPLYALCDACKARGDDALPAEARGLAYQLAESFGHLDRQSAALPDDVRGAAQALRRFGVTVGRRWIFLPRLLKPDAARANVLLWAIAGGESRVPDPPPPGLTSFEIDDNAVLDSIKAAGFALFGKRAVRIDIVERIENALNAALRTQRAADEVGAEVVSLLGTSQAETIALIHQLGWRRADVAVAKNDAPAGEGGDASQAPPATETRTIWRHKKGSAGRMRARHALGTAHPDSPFAGLKALIDAP